MVGEKEEFSYSLDGFSLFVIDFCVCVCVCACFAVCLVQKLSFCCSTSESAPSLFRARPELGVGRRVLL